MRVLVVEDDRNLARHVSAALGMAGYVCDAAHDGEEAQFLGDTEPYDAVILDLGLPKIDGLTILRRWRAAGRLTPVLVLTARGRWTEKVAGLDAGADDYLTKPFEMEECIARLRALIRRSVRLATTELKCGPLELDTRTARLTVHGVPARLTAQEFKLLSYLMHHRGQIVSRTEISEHIYDSEFDSDSNIVDVFVGRLRKKVGHEMIETVRGLGYRLVEPGNDA
jgi:two-component system OmpR family response regulator